MFGYAARKNCYVILLSGLAANRKEGSLHCHDVLIANPLTESAQEEKRDGPQIGGSGKQYSLSYKTADSQTVISSGKTQCVCVYVCVCVCV